MRVRPSLAPSRALLFASVLLTALPTLALAQLRLPLEDLDRSLNAAEGGGEIPLPNRPLPSRPSVNDRLLDRAPSGAEPAAYTAPDEFGVVLEYDGGRVALEAAGVRVMSQVGNIFTARMKRGEIARLRTVRGLKSARLAHYTGPNLNVSAVDVRADLEHASAGGSPPVYNGRAGAGMIIGDVDSGIDFTRSDFMDGAGKTRILYIWDQTDTVGPSPGGFPYGSEWTKSQIDNTPGSVRQTDSNGHGTAVAGVLVGNGSMTGCAQAAYRYVGMAPLAQFIEVKTNFSDAGIIDGVNYIFTRAAALGKDAVVNLSLGSQFGPHDGSDTFATAISGLTGPGRIVVASAGNDQEDQIHGRLTTTSTVVGTDRVTISVPSYTANPLTFNDYFLVTGWYDPTASYTIKVRAPNGSDTLSCGFGANKDKNTVSGKIFIANQSGLYGYGGTVKGRQFEVEVYDSLTARRPAAGNWEIDIVSNGPANIGKRVDTWIYASQLGASALATTGIGLDNTTLVGSPADGDSVFAVGAHATKASWASCAQGGTCAYVTPPTLNAIASFSNVGPRRDGVLKPEITAPGFGVATTHSAQAGAIVTCGDVDDGVHEVEAGTSFSAPHVAGAASLFLSAYPGSSPSRVKQAFEAHARTDGFTGVVPNTTWGYGKLDIYGTFDHASPTVAVTAPAGGESWPEGSVRNITWTATDLSGVTTVDLAYSTDGGGSYPNVITTGIANSGSYAWTVPGPPTTRARVRVTANDPFNNTAAAQSAANFTIADGSAPVASLTAPAGGESWGAGSVQSIQWTASDNLGVTAIDLAYSTDGGATYPNVIASGLANTGLYAWTLPAIYTTTARVRLTAYDASLNTGVATSASDFSIVDLTPPTVTITTPIGGDAVEAGSSKIVTYTSGDNVGVTSFDVEYSGDDGGSWATLATGVPGSPYPWSVPAALVPQAKLRVTAHDAAGNIGAFTTGAFSIVDTTPPAIALTSPNGGEAWTEGESHLIDWSATDAVAVDSVVVEYSLHGTDGPWVPIATVFPDTSGYEWTVPLGVTDSATVRVTAVDGSLNLGQDGSDALFSILGSAVGALPTGDVAFALLPPSPNPGNGSMTLRFRLPQAADAALDIYSASGQRVWSSGTSPLPAGEHVVRWSGRDSGGARVPAGLYFVRLNTVFGHRSVKLVRLR